MLILLIPYQLLAPLIIAGLFLRFLMMGRGKTLQEGPEQIRQRLGMIRKEELKRLRPKSPDQRVLWIHAASVGEVRALTPLLTALAKNPKRPRILVTTSTAAGREQAAKLNAVDLATLAPADIYPAIALFMRRLEPYGLLLVETELWPATLYMAQRWNLKVAIINGRINPRAFAKYRWIRYCVALFLKGIDYAAVQTPEDAERFKILGVSEDSIRVIGNLKFDIPESNPATAKKAQEILNQLGWNNDPVWVAGSTHSGPEEDAIVEAFLSAKKSHPKLRLVIAPRHAERAGESAAHLKQLGIRFKELSSFHETSSTHSAPERAASDPDSKNPTDCLLIDTIGQLAGFYSTCSFAFVGGTIAPVGGHNLLEPAIASKPVIFGPHTDSISDVAKALESSAGGIRVQDSAALTRAILRLLDDSGLREKTGRSAQQTAQNLSGATRRALEFLSPFLFPQSK